MAKKNTKKSPKKPKKPDVSTQEESGSGQPGGGQPPVNPPGSGKP